VRRSLDIFFVCYHRLTRVLTTAGHTEANRNRARRAHNSDTDRSDSAKGQGRAGNSGRDERASAGGRADSNDRVDRDGRNGRSPPVVRPHTPAPPPPPRNWPVRPGAFPPEPSRRTNVSPMPFSVLPLPRCVSGRGGMPRHTINSSPGPQWHTATSSLRSISRAKTTADVPVMPREATRRAASRCPS